MTGSGSLLQVLAGAPWWFHAAIILILVLHIGGGTIAILSGYGAVTARKGEGVHRRFGKIFLAAMLIMTSAAVIMAALLIPMRPMETANIAAGVLAAYLVITGYMTVKRPEMTVGAFERIAMGTVLATGVLFLFWGMRASTSPSGSFDGYQPFFYYVFGGFAALFAALDFRTIRRHGVAGVQRIARHLWRMCAGFFFATGSFFLGQQKVMPASMHGAWYLYVLALAPLGFMIFWLVRVQMGNRFRAPPAQPVFSAPPQMGEPA